MSGWNIKLEIGSRSCVSWVWSYPARCRTPVRCGRFASRVAVLNLVEPLFDRLLHALQDAGLEMKSGQMIDATFVPVPIQRNTHEENAQVKAGQMPAAWQERPNKRAHKDSDARWTKKGGVSHYGYKNHVNVDRDSKLVTAYAGTDASVHDSQVLDEVLRQADDGGAAVHADSAYRSAEIEANLKARALTSQIHEKGYRNAPLTDLQKETNRAKSKIRARVEHVFGHMENSMGGIFLRSIGIKRAQAGIGLMNLTYNLSRLEMLIRLRRVSFDRIAAPA